MRELDADTFRLVNEGDWGDDDEKIPNQGNANTTNASTTAKNVFKPPPAAPTGLKPSNFRK